ncbi:MAG: hypothetical protein HY854_12865 [Burkholderiales bacterium]|nr:hypothetical protein [Burkholderiales bacterium]
MTGTLPVIAMTSWAAPYTGGYERTLGAGEEFTLSNDAGSAASVYADAVNYKPLHRQLIPLSDRIRFWSYRGYYLCIRTEDIARLCELVEDAPLDDRTKRRLERARARS